MLITKEYKIIFLMALLCYANIASTTNTMLSIILTGIEYLLVYYYLWKGKVLDSFILFLAFTSVSMEIDSFIYFDDSSPLRRFTFMTGTFSLKLIYFFTGCIIFARLKKIYAYTKFNSTDKISRWLKWLLISGIFSIFIGMLFDDNGIISSGIYPSTFFYTLLSFGGLCTLIFSSSIIAKNNDLWYKLSDSCLIILVGISIGTILSILGGYVGWYGYEEIMLAPLISGFIPCLLMFYSPMKNNSYYYVIIPLLTILLSFTHLPSVIGSKWYIVIAFSFLYWIYKRLRFTSSISFLSMCLFSLLLLPNIASFILPYLGSNEFNLFKLGQALRMFSFVEHTNFSNWFLSLDESAQFRIDEPINIFMEYVNKPIYSFFGKGIAGTTCHYTNILNWDTSSAFSNAQIVNKFYYDMHESFAVIFLRHGILGLIFFFTIILKLVSRLKVTPWSVVGFIWLVFYWSYGESFRLGAVALVLALYAPNSLLFNSHK